MRNTVVGLEICKKLYDRVKCHENLELLCYRIYIKLNFLNNIRYVFKDKRKFQKDKKRYCLLNQRDSFKLDGGGKLRPCLSEWREDMVTTEYFWMDFWGAKRIAENKPIRHYDIGSRLDGLIAHLLSAGIDVTMLDIRPVRGDVPGLHFIQADATNLENIADGTLESLSAICSLEHFGLGRYGDSIDPEGCFKAFKAIQRVIKPGGYIYIAVPVGKEHIEFNAHRIFYASTVVREFEKMELIEYSSVGQDKKDLSLTIRPHEDIHVLDQGPTEMGLFIFKKYFA